jgi:hypothetical protein
MPKFKASLRENKLFLIKNILLNVKYYISFLAFTKNTVLSYASLPIPIYGHSGNVSAPVTVIAFVRGSLALMTTTQS